MSVDIHKVRTFLKRVSKIKKEHFSHKSQLNARDISSKPGKGVFSKDDQFIKMYDEAIRKLNMRHLYERTRRFYNLVQFFKSTFDLPEGDAVECGCYRGLSSYLMLQYKKMQIPNFEGEGYHIFDSFQGISAPTTEDKITRKSGEIIENPNKPGKYAASLESVKSFLNEFPKVEFHPGWLPESLDGVEERQYRFAHLDLDVYVPMQGTLEYFYKRLVPGGVIVCDDYGRVNWPGATRATDEFCNQYKVRCVPLSTGQAVIFKY